MSTAPATTAGAAAAPEGAAAAPATKVKVENVPKDIRNRVLSGRNPAPPDAAAAAKVKSDKEAADKKLVDDAAAKKKTEDEAAAAKARGEGAAPAGEVKARVRKVKDGPALPERGPGAAPAGDSRSVEQIVRDVLPGITRETAPAAPAIDPEVQREIDLATFAEKKNPERYAGMAGKVKTFFSSHDEFLAAKAKELGGAKSGEFKDWLESDEYKAWLGQNRPSYARGDKAKLAEDLIAERARSEARREMAPEFKALERKTSELEHSPVIRTKTNLALNIIITDTSETKDPAMEGFAKDPRKFGDEHPEEAQLIASEASEAISLIEEVYRLDLDLVDFDPRAPTPRQAKIRDFSIGQNEALRAKHPNGIEMGDGRVLIDADTYRRQKLHDNPKYRVFSADEIAGMIAATRNAEVLAKLKKRREGVAKSVYAPKAAAEAAAPSGQENGGGEAARSPTAGVAAAPGGRGKPPTDSWKDTRRRALSGR